MLITNFRVYSKGHVFVGLFVCEQTRLYNNACTNKKHGHVATWSTVVWYRLLRESRASLLQCRQICVECPTQRRSSVVLAREAVVGATNRTYCTPWLSDPCRVIMRNMCAWMRERSIHTSCCSTVSCWS